MIRHLKIFLVFLVLNTMVASIYLVWGVIRSSEKGQWKNYLFKAEVMFFCPGVGPMFFFVSNLIYKIFFRKAVDLADVIFSKERVTTFKRADIEAEGNLVPIEEALVVSDKGSQRALLLKVARGDIHNSLASISLALNSDDSETAHYAAAVLQDALNDFRLKVQELYEHMKEDEEDAPEYAALMIEYMNNMLSQNVFDELEQNKYVGMMEEAGEVLYQKAKEKLTAIYIECICLRLLQAMEYDRMELWCERSRELHPDVLSTYTLQLKLYFTIQEKQKFFQVLNALKQSDIVIDRDTLALIRAFYETDGEKKKREEAENSSEDKSAEKTAVEPETKEEQNESIKSEAANKAVEENVEAAKGEAANVDIAEAILATTEKAKNTEKAENVEKAVLENVFEKKEPVNVNTADVLHKNAEPLIAQTSQNTAKEIKPEASIAPQSTEKETKSKEAKALQNIFEEIKREEAEAEALRNASKEIKSEEAKALQSIFEEIEQEQTEEAACQDIPKETETVEAQYIAKAAGLSNALEEASFAKEVVLQKKSEKDIALTRSMVSNVIDDLMAENAAAEDINEQINHIIEELIAESEVKEKEAVVYQTEPVHSGQISDKKKIDVLKTIARKHKIWALLGLGIVIASACLLIYMKNKKKKEEQ